VGQPDLAREVVSVDVETNKDVRVMTLRGSLILIASLAIAFFVFLICRVTDDRVLVQLFFRAGADMASPMILWAKTRFSILLAICGLAAAGLAIAAIGLRKAPLLVKSIFVMGVVGSGIGLSYIRYPSITPNLESYCRGFAYRLQREVGAKELANRFRGISENASSDNELDLISSGKRMLPEFATAMRPVILLLEDNISASRSKTFVASFAIRGGAVAVCFPSEPRNPGRFFDYNWHWTNELWLTVRQE